MDALIQAILDAVCGGILGNAAYDVANPIFLKLFPGKKVPLQSRETLEPWLRHELGTDTAKAEELKQAIYSHVETTIKDSLNLGFQGTNQGTINFFQGNATHQAGDHQAAGHNLYLTNYYPLNGDEPVLGRYVELAWVFARLWEEKKPVVIKGMGGLGKSTLARYYVDTQAHRYAHIVWLRVENGIPAGFAREKELHQSLGIDFSQTTDEYERFKTCLTELQKLPGQNLLVLDNALSDASDQNYRSQLPKFPKWHTVLTSRHDFSGYAKLELQKLDNAPARQLFERCYGKATMDEDWNSLYDLTQGHALSLELFGKTLHSAVGRLTPANLVQALREKRLDQAAYDRVISSAYSQGNTTVFEQLLVAFNIPDFTDYQLWLLKQFVALPYLPLDFEELKILLQVPDEDDAKLNNDLLFLEKSGWLQRDDDAFSMHPMIQQAAYYQLHPTDKDVATLVESVTAILYWDQAKDNIVDKFPLVPFGEALLENITWEDQAQKAVLQNKLAGIYWQMANHRKAIALFEAALASALESFGEKHPNVAASRNNLANVFGDLGEHDKARDMLELALASDLESFGEKHLNVAIRRSNLAEVYRNLGEYGKARDLLELALASALESLGEKHPHVAICRSILGLVYDDLGEHGKARDLLELALDSDLENFGEKHPNVAIRRSNLANVYGALGEHGKARDLLELALASDLESFGEKHPYVATRYNNLAWVYRNQGQWQEAEGYFQKAYDILLKALGEDHPNTKDAKQSLAFVQAKLAEPKTWWGRIKQWFSKRFHKS